MIIEGTKFMCKFLGEGQRFEKRVCCGAAYNHLLIKSMRRIALAFAYMFYAILCQIVIDPTQSPTLLYRSNTVAGSVEQKAMEYLFLSYPQLNSFNNVSIRRIGRGRNPFSLQDVYFTLHANDTRISVIASLCEQAPGQFISISPLVTSIFGSNSLTVPGWRGRNGSNFYIISGEQTKIINTGNQSQRLQMPGGFQIFSNSSDLRLQRGEALLASLHPQMVNYYLQQANYQVVSGIKFSLVYRGYDNLTEVYALVLVNLDMEPYLLAFQVRCAEQNNSNMQMKCSDDLAFQIFNACESLILIHPELLAYELLSIVSDDGSPQNGILFILTYQNLQQKTRVMAEINIFQNVFSVMSYYAYSYP